MQAQQSVFCIMVLVGALSAVPSAAEFHINAPGAVPHPPNETYVITAKPMVAYGVPYASHIRALDARRARVREPALDLDHIQVSDNGDLIATILETNR